MGGFSRCLIHLVGTVLFGGFLCATLVRFSPGFGLSEEYLDTRRGEATLARLQELNRPPDSLPRFYAGFVVRYLSGDFGLSSTFERPVRELIAERAPITCTAAAAGLILSWTFSALVSLTSLRSPALAHLLMAVSAGSLQCVPAGVVALLLFVLGWQGAAASGVAVGTLIYPRVVQYVVQLTGQAWQSPHVTLARAKGLTEWRVFAVHVIPACAPQLLSLLGLSIILCMGALIPVEAILDVPGIGQLAWQAALARDLNLLINITVLMTLMVSLSNLLLEAAGRVLVPGRSPA